MNKIIKQWIEDWGVLIGKARMSYYGKDERESVKDLVLRLKRFGNKTHRKSRVS